MRLLFFFFSLPSQNPLPTRSIPRRLHSPLTPTRRSSNPMAIPPMSVRAVIPTEDGLARRFWIKFRGESVLSLYSPFVICLASGSLKIDTFRHYIAQDVHFLKAFAQALVLFCSFNIFLVFSMDFQSGFCLFWRIYLWVFFFFC